MTADSGTRPTLRIIKGEPSPEELAALVAVLARRGSGRREPSPGSSGSAWARYWREAKAPLRPGPGAWRASALPQ